MKVTVAVEGISPRLAQLRTARLQDAAVQGTLDDLAAAARRRDTSAGAADGAEHPAPGAPARSDASSRS